MAVLDIYIISVVYTDFKNLILVKVSGLCTENNTL